MLNVVVSALSCLFLLKRLTFASASTESFSFILKELFLVREVWHFLCDVSICIVLENKVHGARSQETDFLHFINYDFGHLMCLVSIIYNEVLSSSGGVSEEKKKISEGKYNYFRTTEFFFIVVKYTKYKMHDLNHFQCH